MYQTDFVEVYLVFLTPDPYLTITENIWTNLIYSDLMFKTDNENKKNKIRYTVIHGLFVQKKLSSTLPAGGITGAANRECRDAYSFC